jgi:hypothetical protein
LHRSICKESPNKRMKNQPFIAFKRFRFCGICAFLLAVFIIFSTVSADAQIYRKRSDRGRNGSKGGKVLFKRNIVWLDGLGSSQVVGVKYERIMLFGSVVSVRFDLGITPFLMDEKHNFIAGRSITPITGMGFYFHVVPFPVRIGIGASALHDIFFKGIPETATDSTGPNSNSTYRARVMPFALIEVTVKERWTIRAGYTPIIDPPNDHQTELYFTHWGTFGVGYKFGK